MITTLRCPHCRQRSAFPYKPSLAGTVRCAHADCQKPFYVFAAEDVEIEDEGKKWVCADSEIADVTDWSKVETTISMMPAEPVEQFTESIPELLDGYELKALRTRLSKAEAAERYEICAELRDQIKALESEQKRQ